jgi:hypothetical protein
MSFLKAGFCAVFCLFLTAGNAAAHHPSASVSHGAMINSPTASPLGKNRFFAGFAFDQVRFNSIPAGDAHELHEQDRDVHGKNHEETYGLTLGYGALNDLDFYLTAPIVSKSVIKIEDDERLGQKNRATGFGDMRLTGKYRIWKKGVEAALIAGIKSPTGRTGDRSGGAKFEAENQPGSGSWDGEFGTVLSRSFKQRLSLATSFQYFLKTKGAQGHEAGDIFRYNFGASFGLRNLGKYPNLNVSLELNEEWALKDRSRTEKRVFDSGGTTVYLTPGLTASWTKNFSAFLGLPVPVYQNLGGEHEEVKLELLTGVNFYV